MSIKKYYSHLLFLIFLEINLASAQYVWTQKADYGGGKIYSAFSFSIGTKGYAGCGNDENGTYHQDFWAWDQATNVWTQKANFQGLSRTGAAGFSIGGVGYVVAGYALGNGNLNDLWAYDSTANSWARRRTSLPASSRISGVAFTLYNKGYFGLGENAGELNDLWQYDPTTNSWTQESNFPGTVRNGASDFVINNEGYVGLGCNVKTSTLFSDFYKFNADSNSWTQIAYFPGSARQGAYGFNINNKGYIVCGTNSVGAGNNYSIYKDFYQYDPSIDSWSQLTNFPGKATFVGINFAVGNRGYIGLGIDTAYYYPQYQSEFWEYGPVSLPNASFQASDSILCGNGCINFTDHSSNATSWLWIFTGASPLLSSNQNPQNVCYSKTGVYDVTLVASNAGGGDTLTLSNYITVNAIPTTPDVTSSHDTLYCSTDTGYSSYQWYYFNGAIPGATDTFLVAFYSGNYNVKVTNKSGCSIAVGISIVLGLNEHSKEIFEMYPNPVSNNLVMSISYAFREAEVSIYDAIGNILIQRKFDSVKDNMINIDFSNLDVGLYFVSVNIDGQKCTKRVIKNLDLK